MVSQDVSLAEAGASPRPSGRAGALRWRRVRETAYLAALLAALPLLGALLEGAGLGASTTPATESGGLGEHLRVLTGQFLWLRIHDTMHAGVRYLSTEGEHDHDHERAAAVAPKDDFRGWLGDLERQVQPSAYGPHQYAKDPDETLPFYWLLVRANPHFVPGYLSGATTLCRTGKRVPEAIAFLQEGARQNPDSIQIQMMLGHYQLYYAHRYDLSQLHLRRALRLAARQADSLNADERDAYRNAFRWLALGHSKYGHPQAAVAVAERGRRVFPDDGVLQRVLERGGTL